ncbi:MAG: Fic family protein [Burkholderiales bacterium]
MKWNWQQADWPEFSWKQALLHNAEALFLVEAGEYAGAAKHLGAQDREQLTVEAISSEALTSSAIEGEILDRASVQSSIRRQLGLPTEHRKVAAAERGVAEMMVDLHRTWAEPLSREMLFRWHRMLLAGRRDLNVGGYRTHSEPMQVVSGAMHDPKVHFEAPPSASVPVEMSRFIVWFNHSAPEGRRPLPALTRAGIAHQYFICIHPFEDGNGRIGRAIVEKSLAQNLGRPTMTALAATILARRKNYYTALEANNKRQEITHWLTWFAATTIEAQRRSVALVDFLIDKTRFLERLHDQLNERQKKALLRMLREGPQGFEGALSAGQYANITGVSSATATRDLADMVAKEALVRTGTQRHARYQIAIPLRPVLPVVIDALGNIK